MDLFSLMGEGGLEMASRRIMCDKTEIILFIGGKKKVNSLNLTYDQIISITFESCKVFRLFKRVPSKKITIRTSKRGEPIIYNRYKEKKYFEEYKQELEKFCRENRITFYDNLVN